MSDNQKRRNGRTIAVDLDNVIADSDPLIRELIRRVCGVVISPEDMTTYSYFEALSAKGVEPHEARQIEEIALGLYNDRELVNARLVPGATEGMGQLLDAGLSVVFATSRPASSDEITKSWLDKAGFTNHPVLFLQDKSLLAPAYSLLVEDAPHHAQAASGVGVRVCLFDYPWNRSIASHPLIYRAKDWPQIVQLVLHLIETR